MLILSRLAGETVIIGNDIRIQVLSNKKGQIRIGIEAPREIPVRREEIVGKAKAEAEENPDENGDDRQKQ